MDESYKLLSAGSQAQKSGRCMVPPTWRLEVGEINLYCEKSGQQLPTGWGEQGMMERKHQGASSQVIMLSFFICGARDQGDFS